MYEIFEQLLQSNGISAYRFCKDTGISQSTISTWKNKRNLISTEIGSKIAEYFGVSLGYLMTGKDEDSRRAYYLNDETAEMAQEIFENRDLRLLFDAARDAAPEDLQAAHDVLLAMKRKERGSIDE